MKLKTKKILYAEKGFSLVEIIVVLSIMSILSAITIPSFFSGMKRNKFEEMKAILNQYASECLEKFRQSENIENIEPDSYQGNKKIKNIGYKFKKNPNCKELFVVPINNDDESLFEFGFYIGSQTGKLLTYGLPSSQDQDALDMCFSWAGENCNNNSSIMVFNSQENLEKNKKTCLDNFLSNRRSGNNGEFFTWDEASDSCTKPIYIVDGYIYESEDEFDSMNANLSCLEWLSNKENIKYNGQAKFNSCGSNTYFFYNGIDMGSRVNMDYEILQNKLKICETAIERKRNSNFSGSFFFQNGNAPKGCEKVWICKKIIYKSEKAFNQTTCGAT